MTDTLYEIIIQNKTTREKISIYHCSRNKKELYNLVRNIMRACSPINGKFISIDVHKEGER